MVGQLLCFGSISLVLIAAVHQYVTSKMKFREVSKIITAHKVYKEATLMLIPKQNRFVFTFIFLADSVSFKLFPAIYELDQSVL